MSTCFEKTNEFGLRVSLNDPIEDLGGEMLERHRADVAVLNEK